MKRTRKPGDPLELEARFMRLEILPDDFEVLAEEENEESTGRRKWRGTVHTGALMRHPWLGQFAIDVAGIQIPAGALPVLLDHDTRQRVGRTTRVFKDGHELKAEGTFLKTSEAAREVLADADDGFPWQMSMFVPFLKTEEIEAGEEAEVNGQTMHGPGFIARESQLREVTFTALGADQDTRATAEAAAAGVGGGELFTVPVTHDTEDDPMVKKKKTGAELAATVEDGPVDAEALAATAADDATKAETHRVSTILNAAHQRQLPLARDLVKEGKSTEEALLALLEDDRKHKGERTTEIDENGDAALGLVEDPGDDGRGLGAGAGRGEDKRSAYLSIREACHDDTKPRAEIADALLRANADVRKEFTVNSDGANKHEEAKERLAAYLEAYGDGRIRLYGEANVSDLEKLALGITSRAVIGEYYRRLTPDGTWVELVSDRPFPTNMENETFNWLGQNPVFREWVGPRLAKGLAEHGVTIDNLPYELTLDFSADDFRRDKSGQILARIREMAARSPQHWAQLITDLITIGATAAGLCYDGQQFFDTDHEEGASGVQVNNTVVAAGAGLGENPAVITIANAIAASMARLLGFVDNEGQPFTETTEAQFLVLCPNGLYANTSTAVFTDTIQSVGTSISNPITAQKSQLKVAQNPRLDSVDKWLDAGDSESRIAVFRTDAGLKPFIRIEEGNGPTMSAKGEGSEYAHDTNRHQYGAKANRGAGYGYWQFADLIRFND